MVNLHTASNNPKCRVKYISSMTSQWNSQTLNYWVYWGDKLYPFSWNLHWYLSELSGLLYELVMTSYKPICCRPVSLLMGRKQVQCQCWGNQIIGLNWTAPLRMTYCSSEWWVERVGSRGWGHALPVGVAVAESHSRKRQPRSIIHTDVHHCGVCEVKQQVGGDQGTK